MVLSAMAASSKDLASEGDAAQAAKASQLGRLRSPLSERDARTRHSWQRTRLLEKSAQPQRLL